MEYLKFVLPLLKGLGGVLKDLFLGLFLMRKGAEKQQLKDLKAEEKELKDVKEISNRVDAMSDDDLDSVLYDNDNKTED